MSAPAHPARFIGLPNGRAVTLGAYARAWRKVRDLPPHVTFDGWDLFPTRAGEIAAAMSAGLADRVNRHLPGFGVGRKWADAWQWDAIRCARAVNTPRLRVYVNQCPPELRGRLAHRLADPRDL